MMKNGQLKLKMSRYLKQDLCASSLVYSGPWHYCTALLYHQERGEQWYTQRDEAPQGVWNSSDPHRTLYSWTYVTSQEEKSTWRTITDFSISPLKLSETVSSFRALLVYHLSYYSKDHHLFPPLSHALCLSPAHAEVRTTQLCDR